MLNGDILGGLINQIDDDYNDRAIADLSQARLERNKRIAWAIINHFKSAGEVAVSGLGLAAPPGGGSVTGTATGTIQ